VASRDGSGSRQLGLQPHLHPSHHRGAYGVTVTVYSAVAWAASTGAGGTFHDFVISELAGRRGAR
jgi:hypothetical protein